LGSSLPQWLQDADTLLSILGFLITIAVLCQVRSIRSNFLARAELPTLNRKLTATASQLSAALNQWPSSRNKVHEHIKIASALFGATLIMLPKQEKSVAKKIIEKLDEAASKFADEKFGSFNHAWVLYTDIQSCIVTLEQAVANDRWTKS
jgi:hypothetical protein